MKDLEKLKIKMSKEINNFITGITPIFESYKTLNELKAGKNGIDRAYEGGRAAITNSIYDLTEDQKNELYYFYDNEFSAVFDLARHAEFNINQGIQ